MLPFSSTWKYFYFSHVKSLGSIHNLLQKYTFDNNKYLTVCISKYKISYKQHSLFKSSCINMFFLWFPSKLSIFLCMLLFNSNSNGIANLHWKTATRNREGYFDTTAVLLETRYASFVKIIPGTYTFNTALNCFIPHEK